MSKLNIVCKE